MRFDGLWRHPDFVRLWAGQTVSIFGSYIGNTALRFGAILVLDARAYEMALLVAAGIVPELITGPLIGVWVDRLRRRPIMIAADLGRAALLASIPAAYALDALTIGQMYVVAFLTGVLSMSFNVAYRSYLPSLVRRDELLEGNSKLSASESVAEVGAFGIAGWLVQALTAPFAILIDAVSFIGSALFVGMIRKDETPPARDQRTGMLREAAEGIRTIANNSILRATTIAESIAHFAFGMFGAGYALYGIRVLDLQPGVVSMVAAVGGVSSFVGALVAGRAARRLGTGPAMVTGAAFMGASMLLVPLAHGPALVAAAFLMAQQLGDGGYVVYDINQVSTRQAITADRLLGRVNSGVDICAHGAMLVGVLTFGLLGETVGLRTSLAVAAAVMLFAAVWLAVSPVARLREVPGREAPLDPARRASEAS